LVAQPLRRCLYREPRENYETNIRETINVLESAKSCDNAKAVIVITTDKCYVNKE